MNRTSFTFRSSILVVFIGLFVLGILSLILIMRYRLSDGIEKIAFRLISEHATVVDKAINNQINAAKAEIEYGAYLLQSNTQYSKNLTNIENLTTGILKTKSALLPGVRSVFFANEQGDFVRSLITENGTVESEIIKFHEPMKNRELSIYNSGKKADLVKGSTKNADFDPRMRPWYTATKVARVRLRYDVGKV